MRILVSGGCGFIGSVLVPKLLAIGHEVEVADVLWFGNKLPEHRNLTIRKIDVRDYVPLKGIDAIIHLAGISNDPQAELDGRLTWETNTLGTMRLIDHAARHKIRHFIYASSGSVYGIKDEDRVTEDISCEPISDYNKTKMVSERVVLSYANQMSVQILRPGTVCGVSPRQRLDVMVNSLTIQACQHKHITVWGGTQMRPNIHIDDMTDLYMYMLRNPQLTGVFNAGFENLTVDEIANAVQEEVKDEILITKTPTKDLRSYRQCSDKLLALGFKPKKTVRDGIRDMIAAFKTGFREQDEHFNLRVMQRGHINA